MHDLHVQVATRFGLLAGLRNFQNGSDAFFGVPYAEPPIGELRFAPAKLWSQSWEGVRDAATSYGAPCHQTAGFWDEEPNEHPQLPPHVPPPSEDCLKVNIWRPAKQQLPVAPALPVMVWIHGGGFVGGSSTSKWYSGAHLAAHHGVIVVGVEYRLGPLGFLSSPELTRDYGASGGANGLNDQIVALQWVQKHIGSFGGDPSAVTIFGESSGGVAVCVLNASPKAAGQWSASWTQLLPCLPRAAADGALSHQFSARPLRARHPLVGPVHRALAGS